MPTTPRKPFARLGRLALYFSLAICFLLAFGVSSGDDAAYRAFDSAVDAWQWNPEFRAIAMDYSLRGSQAMRTRLLHVPSERVILLLRSLPMLPRKYAVNPTSRQHYDDFSRGPLSAYLHLCGEQDVADMAGIFAAAGRKTGRTEADLREVLAGFKMDFPVVTDQGALQSVSDLLRDTDAARGFTLQEDIGPRLLAPIGKLAADLHVPTDPDQMTAEQQRAVLDRLDAYVRTQDPELWRTKQLNDFCSGIWAQVYGPPYKTVVTPILVLHEAGRILLTALLAFLAIRGVRKRRVLTPDAVADKLA